MKIDGDVQRAPMFLPESADALFEPRHLSENGAEVFDLGNPTRKSEYKAEVNFVVDIAFGQVYSLKNAPIIETLFKLRNYTHKLISNFFREFSQPQ